MRHSSTYYVYIKTTLDHKKFDVGVANGVLQPSLLIPTYHSETKYFSEWKLVYYEYGHSLMSATTRSQRLLRLPTSKYHTIVNQNNPEWLDLSIQWLK